MSQVIHRFKTQAEAVAFSEGVAWTNDSAVEEQGTYIDDEGHAVVLYTDTDGTEDSTIDHWGEDR